MRPISEFREALDTVLVGTHYTHKWHSALADVKAAIDELERLRDENDRLRADAAKGRELAGNMIAEWRRFRAKHFPEIPDTEAKP